MKRIATALTIVCLTFFLSGCGKSQPSGEDGAGGAVNTAPPTTSLGSGSSDADDGSTNPFEEEDAAKTASSKNPKSTAKTNKKPAAKKSVTK